MRSSLLLSLYLITKLLSSSRGTWKSWGSWTYTKNQRNLIGLWIFFFLKHHSRAATPENPEIELLCLELEKLKGKYEVIVGENEKLKTKEKIQ